MSILDRINSPADLKPMTRDELRALSEEMRTRLIEVCSRTGGHIGAGLGVVELTVALHAAFDPSDAAARSSTCETATASKPANVSLRFALRFEVRLP